MANRTDFVADKSYRIRFQTGQELDCKFCKTRESDLDSRLKFVLNQTGTHCLVYWNKGNWKFLNHLERTWFQNPDDVHSIVFVKQSADLHYQRVTDIMLEKFLKG